LGGEAVDEALWDQGLMASAELLTPPRHPAVAKPPRGGTASWPLLDRIAYWLCWLMGIGLSLIAGWIVVYMLIKGITHLTPSLFIESPAPTQQQSQSGGFRDPLMGTLILTVIGTLIAAPIGVAIAAWLSEYGRPSWLARAGESAVEMIAGAPSIVLAIFGLLIFSQTYFGFFSQEASNGSVIGQSFLVAGIIMSLIALPLIVGSTREALAQLPDRLREASWALGKTRATTVRRVLLPSIRPSIASGIVLGMGRIIGDTAIVIVLLGATLKNEPVGGAPLISTLRGTGSTLTSYVFNNSPAGEGNAHEKAYVAAFVLMVIVLLLNALVTRLTRERRPASGRSATLLGRLGSWTR
jgi:phosphate transport system permease protein